MRRVTQEAPDWSRGPLRRVRHAYANAISRGLSVVEASEEAWATLRTNFTLPEETWEQIDSEVVMAAEERLVIVADLERRGLTVPLRDIGVKVYTFRKESDVEPAHQSMDGRTRGRHDLPDLDESSVPVPITFKDAEIPERDLIASQAGQMPLDTASTRANGRQVAEKLEDTVLNGGDVTVGGSSIPGLTNHTDRNTVTITTDWDDAAKTGSDALGDVLALLAAARADNYFGPFGLYVAGNWANILDDDFKAESDKTLRRRIEELESIDSIGISDRLDSALLLVQLTSDVIVLPTASGIRTVEWEIDPMATLLKTLAVMTVAVKSDHAGNSGVVHGS